MILVTNEIRPSNNKLAIASTQPANVIFMQSSKLGGLRLFVIDPNYIKQLKLSNCSE